MAILKSPTVPERDEVAVNPRRSFVGAVVRGGATWRVGGEPTRPEAHKRPQVVVSCLGKLAAFHPTARDYVLSCRAVAPLAALIHPHTPVGTAHSRGSSASIV